MATKGIKPKNINLFIENGKGTRFKKGHVPWNKEKEHLAIRVNNKNNNFHKVKKMVENT